MTLEEFDELLLSHGHDPARWPADQQKAAAELVRSSTEAEALMAEAKMLDGEIGLILAPDTPDGVIAARMQMALQQRQAGQSVFTLLPVRRLAALGSLAGLGGIIAGLLAPAGGQAVMLLLMATGSVTP